jgi:hypothetical protein
MRHEAQPDYSSLEDKARVSGANCLVSFRIAGPSTRNIGYGHSRVKEFDGHARRALSELAHISQYGATNPESQ